MAKKDLTDIFSRTETEGGNEDLLEGNIRATGVGLREGEIKAIDALGVALGDVLGTKPVSRNALLRLAARRLLLDYRAGRLTLDQLARYFRLPEKPRATLQE